MAYLFLFSMAIMWTSVVSYSAEKPAPVSAPIPPVEPLSVVPPVPQDNAYGQPQPEPQSYYPQSYEQGYKTPEKPQQSYGSTYKAPVPEKPQQYGASYGSSYKAPVPEQPQQYGGSYGSTYKAPVPYGSTYKAPVPEQPQQYGGSYGSTYKAPVPEQPQQYGSYGSSYKAPTSYGPPQVYKGQVATGSYGMPAGKPNTIQKCHCYVVPSYEAYPAKGPYGNGYGASGAAPGGGAPVGAPGSFNGPSSPLSAPGMDIAPPPPSAPAAGGIPSAGAGGLSPSDINNLISSNPQIAMSVANQLGVPVSSLASLAQSVAPEQLQSLLSSFAG